MTHTASPPPRYVPHLPLPPYTYVPGRAPHPLSDPAGHSFGETHSLPQQSTDATKWQCGGTYLYGIDLFNHGYYWEAHEAWEAVWHAIGRRGPAADFLKGLIKLAAAGVKVREGRPAGVLSHARRAQALFEAVRCSGATSEAGLSLAALAAAAAALVAQPPAPCDDPPAVVRPLLDLRLVVERV